jgi:hypothetical protein
MIVISVISKEHTAQVALAINNDVVQAFAAERPINRLVMLFCQCLYCKLDRRPSFDTPEALNR